MDPRLPSLAEQLLLIERELRVLDLWSAHPPSDEALASQQPFCIDSMSFEQWLQWILLPRMKQLIELNLALPSVSGIAEMAEEVYKGRLAQMVSLLTALRGFDRLLKGAPESFRGSSL
ncbi:YqcC family protein [Pseudomonas sp. LRF_L74]|uniref:YqcC family protein n=1 Tax=Pseudomonas sp. LRF_L74 TaxID=3369422 RepID=UPI003F61371B